MKILSLITLVLMTIATASAANKYHDFMSVEGKTIRGQILQFDQKSEKVKIERDNNRVATVPLAIFSKEDRVYIKEW